MYGVHVGIYYLRRAVDVKYIQRTTIHYTDILKSSHYCSRY